jgi:leucyl-tRNA---protein transferase
MSADPSVNSEDVVVGAACPYPALPPPVGVRLDVLPEHPCSYLPGRAARFRVLWAQNMPGEVYHGFMDAGFRRSGRLIYQPICTGCRACLPIRVPVEGFRPSKSQRRCSRLNSDLTVEVAPPEATAEKFDLYARYVAQWHGGEADSSDNFEAFLYESPVPTLEFTYRNNEGDLLAVGICDTSPRALSSVYFYFDPASAERGLGTYGALYEIEFAKRAGIPYYYLGYWIDGCRAMEYKVAFRPYELLHPDNLWRPGVCG